MANAEYMWVGYTVIADKADIDALRDEYGQEIVDRLFRAATHEYEKKTGRRHFDLYLTGAGNLVWVPEGTQETDWQFVRGPRRVDVR